MEAETLKSIFDRYPSIMDWLYWGSAGPREIGFDLGAMSDLYGALLSAPIMVACLVVMLRSTKKPDGSAERFSSLIGLLIGLLAGALSFWPAKFAVYLLFVPPPGFYFWGPIGFVLTLTIIAIDVAIIVWLARMVRSAASQAGASDQKIAGKLAGPAMPAAPKSGPKLSAATKSSNKADGPAAQAAPQTYKYEKPSLFYLYQPVSAALSKQTPVSKPAATGKPTKPQSETEATMNARNQYLRL